MLDHYTALMQPDGSLKGFDDPSHYCKLPNALVWGGRVAEADAMLDHCVSRFMQPNGDFVATGAATSHFAPQAQKTLHWEFYDFYAYLNQWWITAGVRLSRNDFIGAAFQYVDAHWYNPKTKAGILQEPLDGRYENCIFTSAHLGFTMLHMGHVDRAAGIGDTIVAMVSKQPHLDDAKLTYYNRFDDEYTLLQGFAPDDPGVKLAAIIDGKEPNQCWWSLGYPVAFLAHLHARSGDPRYLDTAEVILDFVRRCVRQADLENPTPPHPRPPQRSKRHAQISRRRARRSRRRAPVRALLTRPLRAAARRRARQHHLAQGHVGRRPRGQPDGEAGALGPRPGHRGAHCRRGAGGGRPRAQLGVGARHRVR